MRLSSHHRKYFPGLRLPAECRVQVRRMIDHRTMIVCRDEVQRRIQHDMRESLADFVAHACTTRIEHDREVEFSMELFVFRPDEFFQIIEAEVSRQLELEREINPRVTP